MLATKKSIILKLSLCTVILILLLACQRSTAPTEDLQNKLYISLTDPENNPLAGVGLHFYLDYSYFYEKQLPINSQSAGISQPTEYVLYQNFPNPFNPQTTIAFAIPQDASVTLQILDGTDSTVIKTLVNSNLPAGYHQVLWDGTNNAGDYVTNHVYPYCLQSGTFSETRQLFIDMADAEYIRSLNCIPLSESNSQGQIALDYTAFPLQEIIVCTDANGNELGTFDIPFDLSLIFLKDDYQAKIIPVTFHTDQPAQMSVVLNKSP